MKILFIVVLLLSFPHAVVSQDWGTVESLRQGTSLVVETKLGREVKGKLVNSSPDSIQLRARGKGITFTRDEIRNIFLTRRGSVLKRTLIGAAAGAGIGTAIGVGVTAATKSDGLAAAGGFLYGIPAGAAIGALTTGRKKGKLIYSAN